jgi:protein-S-isoprenylcysteine O-methyltransferase Ste14
MDTQQLFGIFLITLVFVFGVVVIIYFRLKHKERLEMIKRGDPIYGETDVENLKYSTLSKAIVFISLAVGVGLGYVLTLHDNSSSQFMVYVVSIFGCLGLGLLVYYFIIKKTSR